MINSIQGVSSMMGAGMMSKSQGLTDDQKNTITEILSQYDPDNVTEEDAQAIFQAFKDAGITPTRGMKEVIEAAGFDDDDLRYKGMTDNQMPPPPPPSQSSGVNLSALQSLQEILNQYDLTNLSEEDQTSLTQKLMENGFLQPGSMVDLSS